MTDKKTLPIAQLLITLMMAASMSGIMSLIAFVLTQAAGRVAFAVAFRVRRFL